MNDQQEQYQPYHSPNVGWQDVGSNDLESHQPATPYVPAGFPTHPDGSDWNEKSGGGR